MKNKIIVSVEVENYEQAKCVTEFAWELKNRGEKNESNYQSNFGSRKVVANRSNR